MNLHSHIQGKLSAWGIDTNTPIAVGVSGGADSLALVYALSACGYQVTALSVDHGLRAESALEISHVADLMQGAAIDHVTLNWQGEKPTSNIQAAARTARYDLMHGWCCENKVGILAIAHHADDQAETFLLRLARGSGLKGLSAMEDCINLSDTVRLVRPLLALPKNYLTEYLDDCALRWIEDPSNENTAFDRVAVRRFLAAPPLKGLEAQRLSETAASLRRAQAALDYYECLWLKKSVTLHRDGYLLLPLKALKSDPEEIILRSLATIFTTLTDQDYPPRFDSLKRVYSALQSADFQGMTLSGLQMLPFKDHSKDQSKDHSVLFIPELAAMREHPVSEAMTWSGLFQLTVDCAVCNKDYTVAPIGAKGWERIKAVCPDFAADVPHAVRLTWPALWSCDGQLIYCCDTENRHYHSDSPDNYRSRNFFRRSLVKLPWT